ncbi:MAG: GDSL-type esterase/lipase family protein [Chitinophagaceae bacterium]
MLAEKYFDLDKKYAYLALGDSYTIGEQVRLVESFPYQTVQVLRKEGFEFYAPEIIAVTGWTTGELIAAINNVRLLSSYNFVSLLIGVNNQYRGRSIEEFENEFESLLQKAVHLVNGNEQNVFVLSIPDWGVTPFAEGRDKTAIATQIDEFNIICEKLSRKYQVTFLDITQEQREYGSNEEYLVTDQLHPSGKEYAKWTEKLATAIKFSIVNS